MGHLKPIACVLTFTVLGTAAPTGAGRWPWAGVVGGLVGLHLGLVPGGMTTSGRLLDTLIPVRGRRRGDDP